jgi:hypothetical protein
VIRYLLELTLNGKTVHRRACTDRFDLNHVAYNLGRNTGLGLSCTLYDFDRPGNVASAHDTQMALEAYVSGQQDAHLSETREVEP